MSALRQERRGTAPPQDLVILCYHALSERWPAALSTTPERFREQLELLLARGYRPVTFAQAVTAPAIVLRAWSHWQVFRRF